MAADGAWGGRRVALLTQHGKERVMGPLFLRELGARLELATGFDTDTLGSFSREIPRFGSQLEAARKKAKQGMALLGLRCGVASEGAFGHDAFGVFNWNVELVILVDEVQGGEIVGLAQGPAHHFHDHVATRPALDAFARKAGFPGHGLIVRPDDEHHRRVRKGLADWPALTGAFEAALAESRSSVVFVESDLRAHLNPTRMEMIRAATENLTARLRSPCPRCGAPGYWRVEPVPGLPCRDCGAPTRAVRGEVWGCLAEAAHRETRDVSLGQLADPAHCDRCNP